MVLFGIFTNGSAIFGSILWLNFQLYPAVSVFYVLQAYTAYLTGMVQFELQEWKSAMEAFNNCKLVLFDIASIVEYAFAALFKKHIYTLTPLRFNKRK